MSNTATDKVLLDIETADVKDSAIIFTISAVQFCLSKPLPFDRENIDNEVFHLRLEVSEQVLMGRTSSESTLLWWKNQSSEAKDKLNRGDTDLKLALEELSKFVKGHQIFVRGTDFEGSILPHAYKMVGVKCPWYFNQLRDVRTYIDALTNGTTGYIKDMELPTWLISHYSLHDCYRDIYQMQSAVSAKNTIEG